MWVTGPLVHERERHCYVFHHWNGREVDRTNVIVSDARLTAEPPAEQGGGDLHAWFLFRCVPQRLCSKSGNCTHCMYGLGETTREERKRDEMLAPHKEPGGFRLWA